MNCVAAVPWASESTADGVKLLVQILLTTGGVIMVIQFFPSNPDPFVVGSYNNLFQNPGGWKDYPFNVHHGPMVSFFSFLCMSEKALCQVWGSG